MNKLINLEIPIGTTDTGKIFKLELYPESMMHCYITGRTGSGKTNLLRAIVKNTINKYNESDVNIWVLSCEPNEFHDFSSHFPEKVRGFDISSKSSAKVTIQKLYDEMKNRFEILYKSSNQLKNVTMSRLLVIIDAYHTIACILQNNPDLQCMFEEILVTASSIGISFVLADQISKQYSGISHRAKDFIQVLFSLKNSDVFEALDISEKALNEEEKKKIHTFLVEPGTFITADKIANADGTISYNISYIKTEYVPE